MMEESRRCFLPRNDGLRKPLKGSVWKLSTRRASIQPRRETMLHILHKVIFVGIFQFLEILGVFISQRI
jgi:hypothetical protein